jgi:2-(1,2-epoxy-1,2-dihydrophenyl)acetyl-CoA isomerase
MKTSEKLQVTLDAGVKRITFNNPARRNAIDFGMFEAFAAAVEESARDESRVLVITGAGEAFCAGLDLGSISPAELASTDVAARVRELINPPVMGLRALPKPVVARVHGPAAGIGFSYVLAADLVVASEDATFSQSFVRVGLMPDGGATYLLPALVGRLKAFELMARGEPVSAQEALGLGLVNAVVPRANLDALVDDLAAALSVAPQPSLARIKAALNLSEREALAASLDFEAEGQAECFRSADFREGITAFMQRRQPKFGQP